MKLKTLNEVDGRASGRCVSATHRSSLLGGVGPKLSRLGQVRWVVGKVR